MKKKINKLITSARKLVLALVNYVQEKVGAIPKDKLLHFFVGAIFVAILNIFVGDYPIVVFVYTMMLAAFKELVDEFDRGSGFSWIDFLFTIAPAILNFI